MGLFDNNNGSFFGSDNNTDNAPSPPPSSTPSDAKNPLGDLGGKFDLSGVDISGGWKQEAKELGKALAQMALVGLAAGLIVVVLFVSAQDLVWLTKKEHISSIPTNIKAPPYAKGPVTGHKFLYGYGAPYSFKDHAILFPFINPFIIEDSDFICLGYRNPFGGCLVLEGASKLPWGVQN